MYLWCFVAENSTMVQWSNIHREWNKEEYNPECTYIWPAPAVSPNSSCTGQHLTPKRNKLCSSLELCYERDKDSTWEHIMHKTARAGDVMWVSWVRKKAGPKNPMLCMTWNRESHAKQRHHKRTSNLVEEHKSVTLCTEMKLFKF
jgi:hypothetical protein